MLVTKELQMDRLAKNEFLSEIKSTGCQDSRSSESSTHSTFMYSNKRENPLN